jgi:hypothetical protein
MKKYYTSKKEYKAEADDKEKQLKSHVYRMRNSMLTHAQFLGRKDYSYRGMIRTLPPKFVRNSPRGHCV